VSRAPVWDKDGGIYQRYEYCPQLSGGTQKTPGKCHAWERGENTSWTVGERASGSIALREEIGSLCKKDVRLQGSSTKSKKVIFHQAPGRRGRVNPTGITILAEGSQQTPANTGYKWEIFGKKGRLGRLLQVLPSLKVGSQKTWVKDWGILPLKEVVGHTKRTPRMERTDTPWQEGLPTKENQAQYVIEIWRQKKASEAKTKRDLEEGRATPK